jgi:hypothetical protein
MNISSLRTYLLLNLLLSYVNQTSLYQGIYQREMLNSNFEINQNFKTNIVVKLFRFITSCRRRRWFWLSYQIYQVNRLAFSGDVSLDFLAA